MLIKDLIKFANELDAQDLKEQADAVDLIIKSIKKLMQSRGDISFEKEDEEAEKDSGVDQKEDSKDDQIEAYGYSTRNFDLCEMVRESFETIKGYIEEDSDETLKDDFVKLLENTDDMLQIEKNGMKSKSLTKIELDNSCDLFVSITYDIGSLAEQLNKDLRKECDFLKGHLLQLNSFTNREEKDDEQ